MLECDPQINTEELINELNIKNGLFRFIRTMREKFQEDAARGMVLISRIFSSVLFADI